MTPKKLLLVDDDKLFHALLTPALEHQGIEVLHAANGASALAIVRESKPDLVVMDGLLPDTDGLSWIERLGTDLAGSRVVFVSSFWKDRKSHERLRELGVDLIVQKPVMPRDFTAKVARLLDMPLLDAACQEPQQA